MAALTASGRPRVFLLDGMALAYRAHFALQRNPLATSRGAPTSAVHGFLAALDRILDQEGPEEIAVVFDAPEPTFRHEAFPEYKATREKMPEEMVPQLGWIRRAVEGMGLPFLVAPGYEADDVIGTLARREAARGKDVWIVSGDKDMLQLVTERVRLYNPLKPGQAEVDLVGPAEAVARLGVPPERVVDALGLMGDASDNVPGVPGVGPKTAARLVLEHGDLEAVLRAAPAIPQARLAENLARYAEQARLSRRLVTIDCDVPLPSEDLARRPPDAAALRDLFVELEMKGRLQRLGPAAAGGLGEVRYHLVGTAEGVRRLARDLLATRDRGGFVLDTETTGLDPMRAELVGLSFAWEPGEAWYVPCNLRPPIFAAGEDAEGEASLFDPGGSREEIRAVLDALRAPLEDASIPKTGQNLKYDVHAIREQLDGAGPRVEGLAFDTMVADFLVDPASRVHNLDDMALRHLGVRKTPTRDLIGSGRTQISMREVPVEKVSRYACEDADVTLRLRRLLEPALGEQGLDRLFREAEMPVLPVLVRMEAAGVRLDLERLAGLSEELGRRVRALEARIREHAGDEVNVRSNAALGAVLYERLRLHERAGRRAPRRTSKGTGWATDEETLQELAPFHELPGLILEHRQLSKLVSTYVESLPTFVHPRTGRVHTTFHPTGAATGRLSSSDPNLQNIPVRTEEGRAIRRAFVPEPGWHFLSADYSQIELRLLAHLSGDEGLLGAFRRGEDVHRDTAARVFGVAPESVTPELRSRAKAVNFGVIYGMGPQRLARETRVSLDEARRFIEGYFATYPDVRRWLDATIEEGRARGFVSTLLGRRRPLPELASEDPRVRAQAENVAVNTPLQGTAADVIKLAMVRVDRRLREEGLRARMLLQVHDELDFEVPPEEVEALRDLVRAEMAGALPLQVPLVVDVGVGGSWADAH